MSPADLATLSLLDPDQGVCPHGHECRVDDDDIGYRRCAEGDYDGGALICWDVTELEIERARLLGAKAEVLERATAFLCERGVA